MRGRSHSENAFCPWRRSIAPGACRCQPMRRSFFELNQEAHAQREPRCRDVIRWSKCSVAVLVFASRSARAWGIAADVHLRIRIFIRLPFRSARHQWGQRGRDIAVPTRSEEHTSELQSLMRISYAVFCLKKKNKQATHQHATPKNMAESNQAYVAKMRTQSKKKVQASENRQEEIQSVYKH